MTKANADPDASSGLPHGDCRCEGCAADDVPIADGAVRAFRVEGMDCAEEIAALRGALGPVVGGADGLSFDFIAGHMLVKCPVDAVSDEAIVAGAARAGLRATPVGREAPPSSPSWWHVHGRLAATATSAAALLAGVTAHVATAGGLGRALRLSAGTAETSPPLAVGLYLAAAAAGAWFVVPRAVLALRRLRPDMNLLMTAAVIGAIAIGEFLEAATVSFLFAVALLLESWSVARARRAIHALLDLTPATARVLDPVTREERTLPPSAVRPGELVVVRPGERLPLDGVVLAGSALVDTAPVTGESFPVAVGPGSEVFAGTISTDGALEIRVNREATETLVARIVRRVADAGRRRARAERWVDRFALVYTPAAFVAAILAAVVPPLAGGEWTDWLYRSLVLLLIGCPCALVISTPVSVVAGLAAAAHRGVLVKGGDLLELPARLDAVAFDKTGTLTRGRLRLAEVIPVSGADVDHVLSVAASLEGRASHPIGRAVLEATTALGIEAVAASEVRALPGRGVEGITARGPAWLGSLRLLFERGAGTAEIEALAVRATGAGRSLVVVAENGQVCGLLALEDEARVEAPQAVAQLRRLGVSRIALVTGDNPETAAAVAAAVGIDDVRASLLPEDKVEAVDSLRSPDAETRSPGGRSCVAFVGDGINDAPALAAADVGIALGEGATDAAVETADVAIISGDLTRLPWLVGHSRRVVAVIRVNIAFALAVKAAFVVLTAAGHASLWSAVAADMGASLLVIANSLRLLRS